MRDGSREESTAGSRLQGLAGVLRDQRRKHAVSGRRQEALWQAHSQQERRETQAQNRRLWVFSLARLKTQNATLRSELQTLFQEEALQPLAFHFQDRGHACRSSQNPVCSGALAAEALQVAALLREGLRQRENKSRTQAQALGDASLESPPKESFEEGALAVLRKVQASLANHQALLRRKNKDARADIKAVRTEAEFLLADSQLRVEEELLAQAEQELGARSERGEECMRLLGASKTNGQKHGADTRGPRKEAASPAHASRKKTQGKAQDTAASDTESSLVPSAAAESYRKALAKLKEKHAIDAAQLAARVASARAKRRSSLNAILAPRSAAAAKAEGFAETPGGAELLQQPCAESEEALAGREAFPHRADEVLAAVAGAWKLFASRAAETSRLERGSGVEDAAARLLQLLLPHASLAAARAAVKAHVEVGRAERNLEGSRRAALLARQRLLADFAARLKAADAEFKRRTERLRAFQIQQLQCQKLREKLRVGAERREARLREEAPRLAKQAALEARLRLEAVTRERLRRAADEKALRDFRDRREFLKRSQIAAEAERQRQAARESLRLRRVNAPLVAYRHSALLSKLEERRRRLRERVLFEEKRKSRLLQRARALRPLASRDRRRATQPTEASRNRQREKKNLNKREAIHKERLRHFHVAEAYSTAALMKDVRFRLSACFHEHGLSLSKAAREVLLKMSRPLASDCFSVTNSKEL